MWGSPSSTNLCISLQKALENAYNFNLPSDGAAKYVYVIVSNWFHAHISSLNLMKKKRVMNVCVCVCISFAFQQPSHQLKLCYRAISRQCDILANVSPAGAKFDDARFMRFKSTIFVLLCWIEQEDGKNSDATVTTTKTTVWKQVNEMRARWIGYKQELQRFFFLQTIGKLYQIPLNSSVCVCINMSE